MTLRIAAISDQHGHLPEIPPCDLLILAGDICPDRIGRVLAVQDPHQQKAWFDRTIRPWLAASRARHKLATWGNHDFCGEVCDFSDDAPASAPTTRLQIVVDGVTHVPAAAGHRGRESISIWATPWSNRFMDWAFMKSPGELAQIYAGIPAGIDILITHQPAYGYGDFMRDGAPATTHLGSHELLAAIERVKPRLVICGHFHEGRGRYEHHGIPIYNVAVVDEQYRLKHGATMIELA